jgi:hypothetical protein
MTEAELFRTWCGRQGTKEEVEWFTEKKYETQQVARKFGLGVAAKLPISSNLTIFKISLRTILNSLHSQNADLSKKQLVLSLET